METSARQKESDGKVTGWIRIILLTAFFYWLFALAADFLSLPGALTAIWPASGVAAFSIIAYATS